MGNSCVLSCWNNRVDVVDNNIKNNALVKIDTFDIELLVNHILFN